MVKRKTKSKQKSSKNEVKEIDMSQFSRYELEQSNVFSEEISVTLKSFDAEAEVLKRSSNYEDRAAVASHPLTAMRTLRSLLADVNPEVRAVAADNIKNITIGLVFKKGVA